MKKLLFLPLFVLFGCQIYEVTPISNPNLKINGKWRISSIIPTYSSDVFNSINVIDNGFFAVSPFQVVNLTDTSIKIRNDTTKIDPIYFYKPGYVWEFDGNNLTVIDDKGNKLKKYTFFFDNQNYNFGGFTVNNVSGNWHIGELNNLGVGPSSDLQISAPEINFDVNINLRRYTKAVTQKLTIKFVR